ncbi:MAG: hypothetical protein M1299_12525 [Firmicutes bacterium]|nr:hypothetical protein [Bacillota bacterium]MCL5040621.1 hypothetical protein [Bacillota bacterium]
MFAFLKKGIFFGLGTVAWLMEGAARTFNGLAKRGEAGQEGTRRMVDEIIQKGREQNDEVMQRMKEQISGLVGGVGMARQEDVLRLEKRLEAIEKILLTRR